MSRLNPNAGEFVPSFSTAPAAAPAATVAAAAPAPVATAASPVSIVDEDDANGYDYMTGQENERFAYSREALLAFKSICDRPPCPLPDVVRATELPKSVGKRVNGRQVYSVTELLQFQPLYHMMPEDIAWTETLVTSVAGNEKKAKAAQAKANKQKRRNESMMMHYDSSLVCYFNPNEYAAAMSMGLYTGPPAAEAAANGGAAGDFSSGGKASQPAITPIEEAVIAKRRLATLLDDVGPETLSSILESFQELSITCIHTLQEVIGLLFDHAIADPSLCESYAQLCAGIAEKTPEFKDGAKTINFRRILLTKCYEALIEEPSEHSSHPEQSQSNKPSAASSSANSSPGAQHSWRRRCMLRNVSLIGELFRRQLLTENVMHVCVAMMLDDDVKPDAEIIEAACQLLSLVGDLLDGSSPASRRTMDEYFEAVGRLQSNAKLPSSTTERITEVSALRTSGWTKKRVEAASALAAATSTAATETSEPRTTS